MDRFDPIAGWQFFHLYVVPVDSSGSARLSFTAPTLGRWRVHAVFLGTRSASPSETGFVEMIVR